MPQPSKQLRGMNSKCPLHYLIVDFHEKTFSVVTKKLSEIMKDGFISTVLLTLRTRRPFSAIYVFSSQQPGVEWYSWTILHGSQQDLTTMMSVKSSTDYLNDLNYSQKSLSSLLSKSVT